MPWATARGIFSMGGIFLKSPIFTGSATAIVTPFRAGSIDTDAFRRLIEAQYAGGTAAIVVCGTTGEGATLSPEEHARLFRLAAQTAAGRMKVIAGIGSNDTAGALDMAKRAEDAGADGLLMVTPYYNKTTQAGLVEHFTYVADRSALPLIVYNVPSRTGVGVSPETYAILAGHANINAVKEASGSVGEFARAKALCGDALTFYSGNDSDTVAMMALGAKGVVSVASNLVPEAVSRLCALCLYGNYADAAALNERYMDLFSALFWEVNPIPVKTAMALAGMCSDEMRLPLVPMGRAHREDLAQVLKKHGLLA